MALRSLDGTRRVCTDFGGSGASRTSTRRVGESLDPAEVTGGLVLHKAQFGGSRLGLSVLLMRRLVDATKLQVTYVEEFDETQNS